MKIAQIKKYILSGLICGIVGFISQSPIHGELFRRQESLNANAGCTNETTENDVLLISRLIQSYLNSDNEMHRGQSMWQHIFNQNHQHLHEIIKKGAFDAAAAILRHPCDSDLFYGIDNLCHSFQNLFQNPQSAKNYADVCLDGMVRFGEAIGAFPLDNPESYYASPIIYQINTVISHLEQFLNLSLVFPNPYKNEYGVQSTKGIISARVPQALYQAWKIKQLVKDIKNPRVLEIGAGVGRTAYYAHLMGIKDYTIIDLPFTALCSGYFLGRTLGENQVIFHGENRNETENLIKVLTPDDFINDDIKYDLIINVDSMTEMDPAMARAYLKKIASSTNMFLSINHEFNPITVLNLVKEIIPSTLIFRHPYWLRQGYVEELMFFKP